MTVAGAAATPYRPRSARYAEKGYPNYAEETDERRGEPRRGYGGGQVKKPAARRGRKRGRGAAAEAAGKALPLILQGEDAEEAEAQEGTKRLRTGDAAAEVGAAAGKVFPSIEEQKVEVVPMDGGADDERGDVGGGSGKSWRLRVKETLRAFSRNYLHFVQEEKRREDTVRQLNKASRALKCQTPGEYGKTKPLEKQSGKRGPNSGSTRGHKPKVAYTFKGNNQDKGGCQEEKRPSKRPDLKALTKMQESGMVLYREKRIGHLPGIDVGDQFSSRAEMVALGIHSHWMKGIDYMGAKYRDQGIYEDDFDKANEIVYTGEGGNNWLGNRQQKTEQILVRGNLALKNSKDNGNPIRVIRGHIEKSSYTGKVYTYDGLYKVVDYMPQKGVRGHLVFQYRLKRLEGQPPLTTSQVRFMRGDVPMPISELPGLVCEDISNGQENFPIPATNIVDNPPVPPSGFVYSKSLQIPEDIKIPVDTSIGCNCSGDCSSSKHCLCAKRNGSDLPYVSTQRRSAGCNGSKDYCVGRLVEPKAVVFECGANCSCNSSCVNRTSQQGLKYRLEVFKTETKGWGVRTWDTILPGALICEYTGVLRRTVEVEGLMENNYIFDIDCLQTINGLDGREQRAGSEMHMASLRSEHDLEASLSAEYCIDAGYMGNIARFINHSCQPNLFIQCVLSSHSDIKLAKIMLFAADTIPPLQELSYDYGYRLDSVTGADGNIVKLACHCGAPNCRKRLY
ncbi:hypothetical protein ACP70R_040010 [Stipagrostis hirtigluma subsp. patula]